MQFWNSVSLLKIKLFCRFKHFWGCLSLLKISQFLLSLSLSLFFKREGGGGKNWFQKFSACTFDDLWQHIYSKNTIFSWKKCAHTVLFSHERRKCGCCYTRNSCSGICMYIGEIAIFQKLILYPDLKTNTKENTGHNFITQVILKSDIENKILVLHDTIFSVALEIV